VTLGSAVMPVAKAVIDPGWLLDELELRLTRCVPEDAMTVSGHIRGGSLPHGECLHRVASNETRGWWNEHGLAELDAQLQRHMLETMLDRSPRFLGWGAVPLMAGYWKELLDRGTVMRIVEWVTEPGEVDRVVRDAVALGLVLPWLSGQAEDAARETLSRLCQSEEPSKLRLGLLVAATYIRDRRCVDEGLRRVVLDICWSLARRVDADTATAVGWVLRELVATNEERAMPELSAHVHELSRQAMRTAVERLPMQLRSRLSSEWQTRRLRRVVENDSLGSNSAPTAKRSRAHLETVSRESESRRGNVEDQ
jgi:hypothetical protein